MIHPSWITILLVSFICTTVCNALISSFSSRYYKNIPIGRLSHSQLRVKQGNANREQRFNVFVLSLLFAITSLRIVAITLLLAAGLNFLLLLA
jgi:hypothetical protein